jgi:hypothetical protein
MPSVVYPENYGQIPAGLVPRNLNEQAIVTIGQMVKGGHNFPYLKAPASDPAKWNDSTLSPVLVGGQPVDPTYLPPYRNAPGLLDLHPERMELDMEATVRIDYQVYVVRLMRNPDLINYGDITDENWTEYWEVREVFVPSANITIEYAEDYDGSLPGYSTPGRPPFDDVTQEYPEGSSFDALWDTVYDTKRHKWYRIKYISFDNEGTPTVARISPPIPYGQDSTTFVQEIKRYRRSGTKGVDVPAAVKPTRPSAFTILGAPNNNPDGWESTIPTTPADQYLWVIRALKELKGDINVVAGWSDPALVGEDNETLRYSSTGKPDPNTIVNSTEDVADGTNEDDLVAAGWVPPASFDPDIHFYKATRTGTTGNWSNWLVERIASDEGTYTKRVYKLLPILSDWDDDIWISANKPSGVDPSNQGWLFELGAETNFLINYFSEATFYRDNSIKYDWSDPRPFTSRDTYNDYITIHPDDGDAIDDTKEIDDTIIRRYTGGVESIDPEKLWLRAQLWNGENDITDDATIDITYQWHKIFNDGEFLTSPVDLGTTRDIQVEHPDVTGRAIFRVTMTLTDASGYTDIQDAITAGAIPSAPVFTEQLSIKDQTDGRDGRSVSASATAPYFIQAGADSSYTLLPGTIIIHAEVDNADKSTAEWYYLDGDDPINDTWVEITATTNTNTSIPERIYINANDDLVIVGGADTDCTDVFDLVGDDVYFKVVIPASGGLSALEDWVMVSKRSQEALAAGESAFDVHVENPYHLIRVDELGNFYAGQIDDIESKIEVRKGTTVYAHTAYTVAVASVSGALSVTGDVLIGNDGGNKKVITVDEDVVTWDNTKDKAYIVLNVTLGSETKVVYIGLGTVLEPAGFTGLNITSSRGTFTFDRSTGGRNNIVLTALLTRHTSTGNEEVAGYTYDWKVVSGRYKAIGAGNLITGTGVSGNQLTIAPADLDGSAVYSCTAYLSKVGTVYDDPFYLDEVRINDMPDNSIKLLYNNNDLTQPPPKPTNLYATYPNNTAGLNSWYKVINTSNSPNWYAISVDGGTTWEGPLPVRGTNGLNGTNGTNGLDGAAGATGAPGGIYSWGGNESIPINTTIAGARVHTIGKLQSDDLGGLWVNVLHNDLETSCRLAIGTTTANAVDLGAFAGNNNTTQWRTYWYPAASLPSETADLKLYLWATDGDGGTINRIIVHAAPSGMTGQSAYVYVGYATDNAGTGFSTTPTASTKYISIISRTTPATNNAALHAGNWFAPASADLWADASWTSLAPFPGFSGTLKYRKDTAGRVWLKGTISTSTSGAAIQNLPSGYRPAYEVNFPTAAVRYKFDLSSGTSFTIPVGNVRISTAGAITLEAPSYSLGMGDAYSLLLDRPISFSIAFDTTA